MATRMKQRRGTAAEWASQNPVLEDGEIGFETDTKVLKLGDGVTAWVSLTSAFLARAGGTMTGGLVLLAPGEPNEAARLVDLTDLESALSSDILVVTNALDADVSNLATLVAGTTSLINEVGDILVGSADNTLARLAKGAESNVLATVGGALVWVPGPQDPIRETFTAAGTWTKGDGAKLIHTLLWAGGGGGGGGYDRQGGGGGGGACASRFVLASELGATESVTIGVGGICNASDQGTPGGATIFGNLKAFGGFGGYRGATSIAGVGGMGGSAATENASSSANAAGGLGAAAGKDAEYGGAGGGRAMPGGDSIWGGCGGGAGGQDTSGGYQIGFAGGTPEGQGQSSTTPDGADGADGYGLHGGSGGQGGKGGRSSSIPVGNGGIGGTRGGGGGGGGSVNGYGDVSDGGSGGRGEAVITTYF
jgi:hypothetical protein